MSGASSTIGAMGLPGDNARRVHSAMRMRMLSGAWEADLVDHLNQHFHPTRQLVIGKPDLSTNVFKSVIKQLAALYHRPPIVGHAEAAEDATAELARVMTDAGWWSMAPRLQEYVLGQREHFVAVHWSSRRGGLLYRLVSPHMVHAEGVPDDPDVPYLYREARLRNHPDTGEEIWTHDVFDVRDPENPSFKIVRPGKREVDMTSAYAPESADSYRWVFDDGTPYIPRVIYHAARTGCLFDAYEGVEMVEGAKTIAVGWTYWWHGVRDASWPQKFGIDVELVGTGARGNGESTQHAIATDPSSLLLFRSTGNGAGVLSQFQPGADPEGLEAALSAFEARLGVHFGIGPGDFQRTGSAESGYALALKREATREAQHAFRPSFERADKQLLRVSAALYNASTGSSLPTDGYVLTYPALPQSAQEIEASLEKHTRLIEAGLASKVDAYLDLNPGKAATRAEAMAALDLIQQENRRFGA